MSNEKRSILHRARGARIVLATGTALILLLSACSSGGSGPQASGSSESSAGNGSGSQATTSSAPSSSASAPASPGGTKCTSDTKTLHLAFVSATTSLNPFQEMALGAKAAAEHACNVELTEVAPPTPDAPKEVQLFESVIHTATDGIAYETTQPSLFIHPLQEAAEQGIPLVAVDTPPPKGTDVKTFVGNSNFNIGAALGKAFVAQNPDPNGKVVLGIDIPTLSVLQLRMKGLEHVIKTKLPNMKIIGPLNSQNGLSVTYNAWNSFVHKYGDAEAFIGVGGVDGVALPKIKDKTGRKFLAGSCDIPAKALQNVKEGQLFALSSPEHWMKGYIAVTLLIKHARTGKPLPTGWWNTGNLLITEKNIDAILKRQKNNKTRYAWFKKHDIPQQLANPPVKPMSALQK